MRYRPQKRRQIRIFRSILHSQMSNRMKTMSNRLSYDVGFNSELVKLLLVAFPRLCCIISDK